MIELPEATNLAAQFNQAVKGRSIGRVVAGHSPHKWAWFHGDPKGYADLLTGRTIGRATAYGGLVEIEVEPARLRFGEGVSLRLHAAGQPVAATHQLLLELDDGSALSGSVQMYGGLWAFLPDQFRNAYHDRARQAPSPLSAAFTAAYFADLAAGPKANKLTAKALLATEQRIPGLGNGVLQDILFEARIHPRHRVADLSARQWQDLYGAVRSVLAAMVRQGGRDTERDLFGHPGGYQTRLSRNTVGKPCPRCGEAIRKESYLGGAVYTCARCQPL